MRKFWILTLLFFAPNAPAMVGTPLVNGGPTGPTVFLMTKAMTSKSSGGDCSGTLVSPNVILTAAHCVKFVGSDVADTEVIAVFDSNPFRAVHDGTIDKIRWSADIKVHPDYVYHEVGLSEGDLALIRINAPAPPTAFPVRVNPTFTSTSAIPQVLVGAYGPGQKIRGTGDPYTILRWAEFPTAEAEHPWFESRSHILSIPYSGGTIICHGDSGSGVLGEFADGLRLIGVLVGALSKMDEARCIGGFFYINIDPYRDWLVQTFESLRQPGDETPNPFAAPAGAPRSSWWPW